MKFASNRNFLHPVLGQQEFLWPAKSFQPVVRCFLKQPSGRGSRPALRIEATFDLDVAAIEQLITEKKAVFGLWVSCAATSYRFFCQAEGNRVQIDISTANIRGQVEAHPQIVTTVEAKLDTSEAHSVFNGEPLTLPPGTPVAVHPPTTIPVLDGDRAIRDIFDLVEDAHSVNAWDVQPDPESPVIVLTADRPTIEHLYRQRAADSEWAIQTLYLAALTEALGIYLQNARTVEAVPAGGWVATITRRLAERQIRVRRDKDDPMFIAGTHPRSPAWVAQRLLGDPLRQRPDKEEVVR